MKSIRIRGASEHNLKNVSLEIPRDVITVFSGVSGSGKSSLAFDTIYKEGQRRFLESLSAYARQFLGGFEKPRVEMIEGLSPTISIDQKTVGRSPRSTVGTITEIYDHLRLLYARLGQAHCPRCGKPVATQSAEQVAERVLSSFMGKTALACAPLVRGRKGEYRQLLLDLRRDGHTRLRIDGTFLRLDDEPPSLRKSERHTIEVVCDRLEVRRELAGRWTEAIEKCLDLGEGLATVVVFEHGAEGPILKEDTYSSKFACPGCGVDLPEMEPRLFSFNSPIGACVTCSGVGTTEQIDPELMLLDPNLPFAKGGLWGMLTSGQFLDDELDTRGFRALGKRLGFSARSSWGDLGPEAREALLRGTHDYVGFGPGLELACEVKGPQWMAPFFRTKPCPSCGGSRLCPPARAVRFHEKAIHEASALPAGQLSAWLSSLALEGTERIVGEPILKHVLSRLGYLERVGLSYLTLDRRSDTLAGGEAQRLRLASQVGAGLQGVLFVLDEPSIGLHPRDNRALLATLATLRDLGNTVLVVEHDQATMEAADHIVDVGPGAGPLGGEIVAQGTIADIARSPRSVTGRYLSGKVSIKPPATRRQPGTEWLEVCGVRENNLKDIDVRIPLGLLVVVTGVSGSGKSSLINRVLRPALLRKLGYMSAVPGKHRSVLGFQHIDKVVDIDQSPIGRTPRSNPATYVKVFDMIRELFAAVPEAKARGYTPGRFSFNKDGGRCLECEGAGIMVVEMQFLPPVEVMCDTCGGKRYNRETLEIHYRAKSIHDVLEMTIAEAAGFFQDHPRIHRPIAMLDQVGLGYMKLGQPSTTLSGGEAQRVKLAAELRKRDTGRTLYLFDEPTTGLHFEDIRVFLLAVQDLVARKNSVIVIEHNVDVMKSADYIVDLGPEAGEEGGTVVAQGTPEEVSRVKASHTGHALREALKPRQAPVEDALPRKTRAETPAGPRDLEVFGASRHNLKSVDVRIPHGSLTVITGVSGSGKTTLAFDTIFAEGQRRYLESLSTYARRFLGRMEEAQVERIQGLAPTIAIDQRSASSNPRSTVATITEIHDYLRLLFARVGVPHCPVCGVALTWTSPSRLAADTVRRASGERGLILSPIVVDGATGDLLQRRVESLRGTLLKSGYTRVLVDGGEQRLDEEGGATIQRIVGAIQKAAPASGARPRVLVVVDRVVITEEARTRIASSLEQAFERGAGTAAVLVGGGEPVFHTKVPACPAGHFTFGGDLTPNMFSFSSLHGACPRCKGMGLEMRLDRDLAIPRPHRPLLDALHSGLLTVVRNQWPAATRLLAGLFRVRGGSLETPFRDLLPEDQRAVLYGLGKERISVELADGSHVETVWPGLFFQVEEWARDGRLEHRGQEVLGLFREQDCSGCGGERLRPESLAVRLSGINIAELSGLTVREAIAFFERLGLGEREATIAKQVLVEILNRLRFLDEVGLEYLTLDRTAATLSGGEAQRIRLASQLGNRLAGVLYVLDEPTVGLHQRDTRRLISSLEELRGLGNTILMVEHDLETMEAADHIIDMGPGAGSRGGNVVASGTPEEVAACPESLTGRYLRRGARGDESQRRRRAPVDWLRLEGAVHNNLRGIDVAFPLGAFTAVSGVSGSGKSSLVLDVLGEALEARLSNRPLPAGRLARAQGLEQLRRLVAVDQKPIGRTPRSNPATYTGVWDLVRDLFSQLPASKVRGYDPGRFSFNNSEGRCFACEGQGSTLVEMHFLSDVWVPCEQCGGKRFNRETLKILFKDKNVGDILQLEVDEACRFFENHYRVARILETLRAVGLGYIRLGQPSNTLSGGEAQRVKLATELVTQTEGGTLYILDEPTTGLHLEDVRTLIDVFQALVDGGNTLVVIEHHLDVIESADWVIDLGPDAGEAGGRVVASGPPEVIAEAPESHTGRCLLERSRAAKDVV